MHHSENLWFEYSFKIQDKKPIKFQITLDPDTLDYLPNGVPETAAWAKLENEKCENCPLNAEDNPYCPIALNLVNILPELYLEPSRIM